MDRDRAVRVGLLRPLMLSCVLGLIAVAAGCSNDGLSSAGATSATALTAESTPASGEASSSAPTAVASSESTTTSSAVDECSTEVALDIQYQTLDGVDPNLVSLDVYPVAGRCDAPVAVWVHGGGWRRGDKQNMADERAAFYNSQGWMVVAVNYRLTTPEADPAVQYPDHNRDVAAALGWVHDEIAAHGGDPERVLLVGHSAGASIAASIVADPSYLAAHDLSPDWLACAVLLDTAAYDIANAARSGANELYVDAFGSDPSVWEAASPLQHVGDGPLPSRVLIVTRGSAPRIGEATTFGESLAAEGVDAVTFDASPLSHGDVNGQIGQADSIMTPLMVDELGRCATASPATT